MSSNTDYWKPSWAPEMLSIQRITALDLARFIAMVMMVQGHTIGALTLPEDMNLQEFPWTWWHYARGFTAQVFLIVSGTVHVFANKRMENGRLKPETIKRRIRMALLIMGIGYLFAFPANKIWDIFFLEDKYWISFCRANILQLIGVTLLLALLLFKYTKTDKSLGRAALFFAILISVLSPFVHYVHWFDYLPEFFASYLSFEHRSFFPIFPYTAFLFYGIYIGTILKRKKPGERTKFIIKWFLPAGIILVLAGFGLRGILSELSWSMLYKTNPGVILYQIGFVLTGMAFWAFIYTKTRQLTFFYAMFGKRALMIYVLHLIVLYGTPWFASIGNFYYKQLSVEWAVFFAIVIEIITFGIVFWYEYLLNKYEKFRKYYLYVLGAIVAYLVLVGNVWMW
ncbi:heparan-alpha-glucosaminide N-acetyltransferase domain-containing protein [Bacteroidota bacterium]